MKTKKKKFDAVKSMRQIRDRMSKEIMNMTFEEEKEYIRKILSSKNEKSESIKSSPKKKAA